MSEQFHPGFQPRSAELFDALCALSEHFALRVPDELGGRRLTAALVSFVDDHDQPFPEECFPAAAAALIDEWPATVTVPQILASPSCLAQGSLLEAVLVAHFAVRQLARGRDGRACPPLRMDMEARLARGRGVLPFHPEDSRGGDPLGDVYHYLATLAAGLAAGSRRRHRWMLPLFAAGPELMWTVREACFGAPLFYGNHARIDRMGLVHGWRLARR
ncbi:MAG: hypothetical protein EP330_28545 [Deltaproteobacteria bacterium]|nr:MAG: hypothetical protein EP330_28545 [Deltaproteobacteria bacterium]